MQRLPHLHELSAAASASASPSQLLVAASSEPVTPQQQQQPRQQPQTLAAAFNGDSFFPFAHPTDYGHHSYSHPQQQQQQQANPRQNPHSNHPFAASLDPIWDPFPAPATSSSSSSSAFSFASLERQFVPFSDFMPRYSEPAMSRLATAEALRLFLPSPPRTATQEIDLTLSSSDSDDDSDIGGYRRTSSAGDTSGYEGVDTPDDHDNDDADDDGEVEILQTRLPARAASPAAAAAARYLTYTSVPPLRRKRRRIDAHATTAGGVAATVKDDPVDLERFNGKRAESTSVSMENNETIERFKKALKCSICLDVIEEMTSTTCGHVYCGKCIRAAIRITAKCPLCQRKLRPKDTHRLYF